MKRHQSRKQIKKIADQYVQAYAKAVKKGISVTQSKRFAMIVCKLDEKCIAIETNRYWRGKRKDTNEH